MPAQRGQGGRVPALLPRFVLPRAFAEPAGVQTNLAVARVSDPTRYDRYVPVMQLGGTVHLASAITVERHHSLESVARYREEWNRLSESVPQPEVFTRFEYLGAWLGAHVRAAQAHVITITEGGRLRGAAPLMYAARRMAGVTLQSLEFLGSPQNDYADFIYSGEDILDRLLVETERSAAQVDLVHLAPIKETSPTCLRLKRFGAGTFRPMVLNWSRELPAPGAPVPGYLTGHRIRPRTLRRIEKEGDVALCVYDSPSAIRENLPILFKQHIDEWAGAANPSHFRNRILRDFYFGLADALSPHVVLCVLTLNRAPVASLFGFVCNRKLVIYTLARKRAYDKFHCGLVCILKTMQAMGMAGIGSVDFTRGDERFKSCFANTPSVSYESLWPRTIKAKLALATFLTGRDLVVSHPLLKRFARLCGTQAEGVSKRRLTELLDARASNRAETN
jgi:CelD/BcsL family acetyltransferase involved in cellulose biosynthesis